MDAVPPLLEASGTDGSRGPDDPNRGDVLFTLAQCLVRNGHPADAEVVLRENWAHDRAHLRPDHPAVLDSLTLLNQALTTGRKPTESEAGRAGAGQN